MLKRSDVTAPLTSTATRDRQAYGFGALAFLVAASRWGSYLGSYPVLVTDLLLLAGLVALLLHSTSTPLSAMRIGGRGYQLELVVVVFLCFCLVRLATSPIISTTALRDFAPYGYAFVALLAGLAVPSSIRGKSLPHVLWWALIFHAAWVALGVVLPGIGPLLPSVAPGVRLFQIRTDIDSLWLGVTAVLAFMRWYSRRRVPFLLLSAGCSVILLSISSRSGLLALLSMILLVLLSKPNSGQAGFGGMNIVKWDRTTLVLTLITALAIVLPFSAAGSRLLNTVGIGDISTETGRPSATGTTDARENAWDATISYGMEGVRRSLFGVGFGPDFMSDSGAKVALLGTEAALERDVRSPHNYFVGSFARLGAVGVTFLLLLSWITWRAAWKSRENLFSSEIFLFCACAFLGLLVVGLFGVVLESPFGAVPFFWTVGVLTAFGRRGSA